MGKAAVVVCGGGLGGGVGLLGARQQQQLSVSDARYSLFLYGKLYLLGLISGY